MNATNFPPKVVYTVVDGKDGRSHWVKLGIGFVNHDGSMNLKLDALPVNGMIQVRDYQPFEDRKPNLANTTPSRPGEARTLEALA
jgi:hypothetical protein